MRSNRLRKLLDQGSPTLGTHVITPWPGIVEVIGQSEAFDYVEYVGEYSPFSLELFDNLARAVELSANLSSMMKVEEHNRGFIATRALDAGFESVLFADCRSAEDVRECIRVVRPETPEAGGTHGAGMRRNIGYVSYAGSEAWVEAMNRVVIAIMIEKQGAMESLEEILSVEGVDMVQFGPADYSISIGRPGDVAGSEVQGAHQEMIARALEAGVHPRVEVVNFHAAKPYVDLGVRHFCVGWDLRVLSAWCRKTGKGMQELLDSGTGAEKA